MLGIVLLLASVGGAALSTFGKAQTLPRGGQIVQSALSTARQYAITTRIPHRVIFYQRVLDAAGQPTTGDQAVDPSAVEVAGIAIFRGGKSPGYTGKPQILPATLYFRISSSPHPMDLPFQPPIDPMQDPKVSAGWIEFRGDNRAWSMGNFRDVPPYQLSDGQSIFDPNLTLTGSIPAAAIADIEVRQMRVRNRRCFIDINPATGRAVPKVLDITTGGN